MFRSPLAYQSARGSRTFRTGSIRRWSVVSSSWGGVTFEELMESMGCVVSSGGGGGGSVVVTGGNGDGSVRDDLEGATSTTN